MFSFWTDLPWYVRIPISLGCLGLGGYLLWTNRVGSPDWAKEEKAKLYFFFGVMLFLLGGALFMTGGPSDSDKGGYKF